MGLTRKQVVDKLMSSKTTRQTKADAVRILASSNTRHTAKSREQEKKQKKKYNIK